MYQYFILIAIDLKIENIMINENINNTSIISKYTNINKLNNEKRNIIKLNWKYLHNISNLIAWLDGLDIRQS